MWSPMKSWLFNLIYFGLLTVFSPLLLYRALKQGKYRRGFKQKYFGRIPRRRNVLKGRDADKTFVLWFHAVSVGEVNLLRPLLQRIRETKPDWCCVVSTTSQTGSDVATKLYGEHHTVFYCPLDFSWAVDKAMQRLRPNMLVLAEQELWPNLIDAAKRYGAKVAVVNGRMSEEGYKRYLWVRPLLVSMFRRLDAVASQNDVYAGWFRRLGASSDAIHVIGSMKFDGAVSDRSNPATIRLRELAGIAENDIVFLAGSTQSPEESFAIDVYEHLKAEFPRLRLILVPRHPERFDEVVAILDSRKVLWERRSLLKDPSEGEPTESLDGGCTHKAVRPRILLVDTIGELGAWWGTASIAFVGGSMGTRDGQNMIEPAAYGAAVCFGPKTKNFTDIVDLLLRSDAAQIVHDQREMELFVRRMLEEPDFAQRLGGNARRLVEEQLGATERTLHLIESTLFPDDS